MGARVVLAYLVSLWYGLLPVVRPSLAFHIRYLLLNHKLD